MNLAVIGCSYFGDIVGGLDVFFTCGEMVMLFENSLKALDALARRWSDGFG